MSVPCRLVVPGPELLDDVRDALRRGWSPTTDRDSSGAVLAEIDADPEQFVTDLVTIEPHGRTVEHVDGSHVPRLPSITRWIVADGFAGSINLRWTPGSHDLPPHCLGHVGYTVVPWQRGRGLATHALSEMLPLAREQGLRWIDVVADLGNIASQKVAVNNGAELVGRIDKGEAHAHLEALLFRIRLD